DLTEQGALKGLMPTARIVETECRVARRPLPRNRGGRREFDCMLVDTHCGLASRDGRAFPVVLGLVEEGERVHRFSSIRCLTHIQLAVRDQGAILGMWSVRP